MTSCYTTKTTTHIFTALLKSSPGVVSSALPSTEPSSFMVATPKIDIWRFSLQAAGIAADQEKLTAIKDFPTPFNLIDLRSFMGLVNQLAEFTPAILPAAQPLHPLMTPKRQFMWTAYHDEAFRREMTAISRTLVRLYGVVFALLQDHGGDHLRPAQCGSGFLTEAETRYTTNELEMLAVVWVVNKCKLYLAGFQNFTVISDPCLLIPIIRNYSLDAVENPPLQRLKDKLSPYLLTAVWLAGKTLCIPNSVSFPSQPSDTG